MAQAPASVEAFELEAEVRRLVDDYRPRAPWFLKKDYYPRTSDEILRVLGQIERQGDAEAFRRAAALRRRLASVEDLWKLVPGRVL